MRGFRLFALREKRKLNLFAASSRDATPGQATISSDICASDVLWWLIFMPDSVVSSPNCLTVIHRCSYNIHQAPRFFKRLFLKKYHFVIFSILYLLYDAFTDKLTTLYKKNPQNGCFLVEKSIYS
jgi:hypothetical protein